MGSLVRWAVPILAATIMTGCFVTRGLDCPIPANVPPSVESSATLTPLNQIVRIDLDELGNPDGGMANVPFEAVLRDPDVADDLQVRVWVDYSDALPLIPVVDLLDVDRNGDDPSRATLSFPISVSRLAAGCHRVELRVTRAFVGAGREPVERGDLGTATWWVASSNDLAPEVLMLDCP
ncbi:MAG: hypothetical protein IT378_05685 [Sandaracinaceae bacterium]|nr:hypothetical protein [Sandaracinaceae bacterium]MCC6873786.1 hypothetical protein [Sandaracinaceae bacterium]